MTDENSNEVTRTPTREPLPQSDAPRTVTGYHVETDLDGTTHITLELRKGGTLSLHDLDPLQALLYLDLLRNSGPRIHAIWTPSRNRLQWRTPASEE